VDAGAIGAGHAVTALYVIRLRDDGVDLGRVRLRWTAPGAREGSRLSLDITTDDLARSFRDTDRTFKLDAIVAAAAEVLRESPYAEVDSWRLGRG
jgi:Ca-activated chloride channel family protein